MPLWRYLAFVFLGVIGVIALTVWYFPNTSDFRAQNPFWNGLEHLGDRYNATPLLALRELPEDPRETILIVIPYLEPGLADLERLKTYLEGGGILVLADDWGFGNTVLEGLGVPAAFSGSMLLDPLFNYRDGRFPLVTESVPSPLTAGVSSLALNYATVLVGSGFTPVAHSSAFSYLDLDGNGERDDEDVVGPHTVIGYTRVGDGQLVLLSDPSLLINAMLDAEDNSLFLDNLVGIAGPKPRVFVDQQHLPPSRLDDTRGILETIRESLANPAPLAALTAVLAVVPLAPLWRRKGAPAWTSTR